MSNNVRIQPSYKFKVQSSKFKVSWQVDSCQSFLKQSREVVSRPRELPNFITKNEVSKESGEACTLQVNAIVTGEVSEKDGRLWITPSKIIKK
jgi:hypothetical protein